MISNLVFLLIGLFVGGLAWPATRPLYEMGLQRLYQRAVTWRMKRKERREQRATIEKAKQHQADLDYVRRPETRSPRTQTLRTRRETTKRSRQQHRDRVASLQKLKQRRNKGRIPLHVRVAPKGWRHEEAA